MAKENTANSTESVDMTALKAELKAELREELRAEMKTAEAAQKVTEKSKNPWLEEYVDIQLFKDGQKYKDDVYVSVNGENCLIKRGVPVKIKRKFALVIEQSVRQDTAASEYAEACQDEFKEVTKQLGM